MGALQFGSMHFTKKFWTLKKHDSFHLPLQKSQSSFEDQQFFPSATLLPADDLEADVNAK